MKIFYLIIIANILLLSSCKPGGIEQNGDLSKKISQEEADEEYADRFSHFGWIFEHGSYYLLSDAFVYENSNINSKIN